MRWIKRFLIFFLSVVLVCLVIVPCADRIAAFSVNHFTDYRLSYSKWGRNPFDRREIDGVCLRSESNGFVVRAEKIRFDPDLSQLLARAQVTIGCEMEGVSFEGAGSFSSDNILAFPFTRGKKYQKIRFKAFLDKNTVKISDFTAFSPNIRMKGDYTLVKDKNEISVELKLSFSPEMAEKFPDNVKDEVLFFDEDGWYSTVISYKGNRLFLTAISSLARNISF